MALNPNLKTTENQTIVSGPCIAGRKTAGSGGMEELTGADVVGQLPAATASADGKMTKEQAAALLGSSGRDFATVAEAEAATYTEPEHCSVTETGKAYIYNASSAATVDGDYVLSVENGVGRLLCIRALVDQLRTDFGNSVFLGQGAGLNDDGTDNQNVGVGINALRDNTTGFANTANGYSSLFSNTTGAYNTANGYASLYSNTTGASNIANGLNSLYSNTTGSSNTANGRNSLYSNTTGINNIANGFNSGRYIADGTSPNQTSSSSVYIGANTKALADGDINETVIGHNAKGNGSNTVTIGNDSVTNNYFNGEIKTTCTTSDSSSFAIKYEDSTGKLLESLRADGQIFQNGGIIVGYDTFTSDTTLTQSSPSCAIVNPSGEGIVITMHLSPPDGIKQRTVNVSAFAVTLGRNGQKMSGDGTNYTLSEYTAIDWQYYGATIGWIPISISTW